MKEHCGLELILVNIEIVPYVRMTQRSKYVNKQAQRYMASKSAVEEAMNLQIRSLYNNDGLKLYVAEKKIKIGESYATVEMKYPIPLDTPFEVYMDFVYDEGVKLEYCDIDNLAKAIMDAGNKIVYWDDRWCNKLMITRSNSPRVDSLLLPGTPRVKVEYTWLS